jgi:hypothetical protein
MARREKLYANNGNFSPQEATAEIEDYKVDLDEVASLELTISPDVSDRNAVATLAEWHLA